MALFGKQDPYSGSIWEQPQASYPHASDLEPEPGPGIEEGSVEAYLSGQYGSNRQALAQKLVDEGKLRAEGIQIREVFIGYDTVLIENDEENIDPRYTSLRRGRA